MKILKPGNSLHSFPSSMYKRLSDMISGMDKQIWLIRKSDELKFYSLVVDFGGKEDYAFTMLLMS